MLDTQWERVTKKKKIKYCQILLFILQIHFLFLFLQLSNACVTVTGFGLISNNVLNILTEKSQVCAESKSEMQYIHWGSQLYFFFKLFH